MEEVTRYDVFTTNKGQMHEFTIPFYLDRLSKSSFHKPTPEHNPPECQRVTKHILKLYSSRHRESGSQMMLYSYKNRQFEMGLDYVHIEAKSPDMVQI